MTKSGKLRVYTEGRGLLLELDVVNIPAPPPSSFPEVVGIDEHEQHLRRGARHENRAIHCLRYPNSEIHFADMAEGERFASVILLKSPSPVDWAYGPRSRARLRTGPTPDHL